MAPLWGGFEPSKRHDGVLLKRFLVVRTCCGFLGKRSELGSEMISSVENALIKSRSEDAFFVEAHHLLELASLRKSPAMILEDIFCSFDRPLQERILLRALQRDNPALDKLSCPAYTMYYILFDTL